MLAEQELQEYRERSDRLLAQIDQQHLVVEKHRQEIEDNALKPNDGRRLYVDGSEYRDEQGAVLEGRDRHEAAALHNQKPVASTWHDRQKNDFISHGRANPRHSECVIPTDDSQRCPCLSLPWKFSSLPADSERWRSAFRSDADQCS
ncbi:MAG: hypothetical protein ACRD9L_04820, partial [Bryobacteraceae bacterium]